MKGGSASFGFVSEDCDILGLREKVTVCQHDLRCTFVLYHACFCKQLAGNLLRDLEHDRVLFFLVGCVEVDPQLDCYRVGHVTSVGISKKWDGRATVSGTHVSRTPV